MHHLEAALQDVPTTIAIDFGSGSTFFPIAVAREGGRIICFDNDPVVIGDLRAAARTLGTGSGSLEVRLNDARLPMDSASADFGYSISVLEHMDEPVALVSEIARVLKPGATFVLTMDLDVKGSSGVSMEHYEGLRARLETVFEWVRPDRVIHPLDMLTSANSPWPRPGERRIPGLLLREKSGSLRPIIGGPNPGVLTVYGCVLRRR
ncbi:MAG: hypothetical protein DLM50_00775 [Candidatus Meridianibacter frigidus]|nr:MAG: hypothetical protein DLM50_00775 [Candidatus Eremiobacteraeota bacterium]